MSKPTLEERIQRLEDERAVLRTLYQYAHSLDYGPEEAFVDVFTPNGRWTRATGRFPDASSQGSSEFAAMYRRHTHAPEVFHKHLVANPSVEVEGDLARARFYFVYVSEHPDGPYIRAFSRCNDTLVRCKDGVWRIDERVSELEAWERRNFPRSEESAR
jgi:hypothetical protein